MTFHFHTYFVYIVSNKNKNVTYIGVTNNLKRRLFEHKNKLIPGFTSKYNVYNLVYYESFNDINQAIAREKQLKKFSKAKKHLLIERMNPNWEVLL